MLYVNYNSKKMSLKKRDGAMGFLFGFRKYGTYYRHVCMPMGVGPAVKRQKLIEES